MDLIFSRKTREKTCFFVSGAGINQKNNFLKKHEKHEKLAPTPKLLGAERKYSLFLVLRFLVIFMFFFNLMLISEGSFSKKHKMKTCFRGLL